jgi:hypothetical protein
MRTEPEHGARQGTVLAARKTHGKLNVFLHTKVTQKFACAETTATGVWDVLRV